MYNDLILFDALRNAFFSCKHCFINIHADEKRKKKE